MKSETQFRDILALQVWANLRAKATWISLIISGFVMSLAVTFPVMPKDQGLSLAAFMLIAGFSTGAMLVILLSIPLVLLGALTQYLVKGSIGVKHYDFNEECFTENDGYKATSIRWQDIKGIYKTSRHIIVKIGRFKHAIISRRDFNSEYEFASFYANLVKYRETST